MPTEMLDRLQEEKLHGLEALNDSYESETSMGGGNDEAAAIADFFVDEGIGVRQSSLRLWDHHWTMALAGVLSDQRESGAKLRSLLERGGRLLWRGAHIARAYADMSGQEVARLVPFEEQCAAFPLWVKECMARWEMLYRPRKPLHHERIAESCVLRARRGGGRLRCDRPSGARRPPGQGIDVCASSSSGRASAGHYGANGQVSISCLRRQLHQLLDDGFVQ